MTPLVITFLVPCRRRMGGMRYLFHSAGTMTIFQIIMTWAKGDFMVYWSNCSRIQRYYESTILLSTTNYRGTLSRRLVILKWPPTWSIIYHITQSSAKIRKPPRWGLCMMPLLNQVAPPKWLFIWDCLHGPYTSVMWCVGQTKSRKLIRFMLAQRRFWIMVALTWGSSSQTLPPCKH